MKKLAMIGCGGIGRYHLRHFLEFNDIELAGFCDYLNPEHAEEFVVKAGSGKAFTNYMEMYDEIKPDMVFICVPPTEHGAIELEAIKRGIPFFVEKPVALCMELATQIREEVKKAGLITAAGFQSRYSNLVEPTIEFIRENEVIYIDCVRVGEVPGPSWWKKRSTSGGQIVEQAVHQLDIIRYVFGEPDTVFTMGTKGFVTNIEGYDTEDLSTTVVRFKNGALATISTGCYATGDNAANNKITFGSRDARAELSILNKLELYGVKADNGTTADDKSDGFVIKSDGALNVSSTGIITYKQEGKAGILCDRTFIDAVLTGDGSKIRSSYEDAVRSLAFTLACNQSMDTGLPVKVNIA